MLHRRWLVLFTASSLLVAAGCASDAPDAAPVTTAAPDTVAPTSTPTTTAASATSSVASTTATTDAPTTTVSDTTAPTPVTTPDGSICAAPTTTTPTDASAVSGSDTDWSVTSFDGTVIRAHWFPLPGLATTATAPTVLMGPGWGSPGDTDTKTVGILGALNIATLWKAGYNVLTWDPRGFGKSTGTVEIDSVDAEARDVEQLIDWVSTRPQAELDATRDPRVGMVGGSYGGGIQFVTAAIDCRIDAIVPVIAWHSLTTSLFKADTPKTGWANILSAAAANRSVDAHITSSNASSAATGTISADDAAWFASRGPGDLISKIKVPTLLIQSTVDTLFTLDEAVTNYGILTADKVPTAMVWFCGGHGVCLTNAGDQTRTGIRIVSWLDRYLKRNTSLDTGPGFELVDQDGVAYSADAYAAASGTPLTATGKGVLKLVAKGGAGPTTVGPDGGVLGGVVGPITPAKATNAVSVKIPAGPTESLLMGAPQLTLTYKGTTPAGDRPTRVFAQLVDDTTGKVLGNQITPIEVTLDGVSHTVTVPLEMIAFTAHVGSSVSLQLVATTVAYAQPRLGGSVDFTGIQIQLPVDTAMTVNAG